jgi:hypothetical protein
MQLIEILLPLRDPDGEAFAREAFGEVIEALTERFGGVTAFTRSPAEGVWQENGAREKDEIVILEVMAETLERDWWRDFRKDLERRFRQDEIVVRASAIERI